MMHIAHVTEAATKKVAVVVTSGDVVKQMAGLAMEPLHLRIAQNGIKLLTGRDEAATHFGVVRLYCSGVRSLAL
jgi:anti-sigma factor RsiW